MRGTHTQLTITTTEHGQPLFSFPVQICKATGSTDVKFDSADPEGFPVEQVYRRKGSSEIFAKGDLIKGVRTGDSFAAIAPAEIEKIDQLVSLPDMRVERSVSLPDIPFDRATGFYYLQAPPEGGSHRAYETLRQALAGPPAGRGHKAPVGLQVKFTSRTRQKLGVVYAEPTRECLALVVLSFAAEVREPDEAVMAARDYAEVDPKEVRLARQIAEGLSSDLISFDTPEDEAISLKRELIAQAAAGEVIEVPDVPEVAPSTEELESVLEASLS